MNSGMDVTSALVLSLVCAAVAVALCLLPAMALAMLLARRNFRGKAAVELMVFLPAVVPPVVTGYLLLMLVGRNGMIGQLLHQIGLTVAFTWFGAAVAQAVVVFPLLVLVLRAAFGTVDRELELAAQSMGAGRWQMFWWVTLPLSWPGVAAACALGFARAMGEFGATIVLAGNISGRTRTLPLAIFTSLQTPGRETQTMGMVALGIALAMAALAVYRWLMRQEGQPA